MLFVSTVNNHECTAIAPIERDSNRHYDLDEQNNPRLEALAAIRKQYPTHSQTLSLLRDRATNDPDSTVRKFAGLWLGGLWLGQMTQED